MSAPLSELPPGQIDHMIAALDSLVDGELAVTVLVACGQRAVPHLSRFLLDEPPRTIALPRCRAVHALGELQACSTLISYFRQYRRPADAAVLFAEDTVRSAVARELLRWKSDEVFQVLLGAARERTSGGLVFAISEFRRPEGIPLLFEALEDDLCREDAKNGLRWVPESAHQYIILSIRGTTGANLDGPSALRRRRAALQLLGEFGTSAEEWRDLRSFLFEEDADVVIAAAQIGMPAAPEERSSIFNALFRVSDKLNWAQEGEITALFDADRKLSCEIARRITQERGARDEQPNWLEPSWRILRHVLDQSPEGQGSPFFRSSPIIDAGP